MFWTCPDTFCDIQLEWSKTTIDIYQISFCLRFSLSIRNDADCFSWQLKKFKKLVSLMRFEIIYSEHDITLNDMNICHNEVQFPNLSDKHYIFNIEYVCLINTWGATALLFKTLLQ